MRSSPLHLALLGSLLLALFGWGCDSKEATSSPKTIAPSIRVFEAEPAHLEEPGEITLSWAVSGAATIEIIRGGEAIDPEASRIAEGSLTLAISETTVFTMVARNGGITATATQRVTVDPLRPPSIAEFGVRDYAEADETGEATATLSWAGVERATSLHLLAAGRDPVVLDASAAEGSAEVRFSEDTTFTLVATNAAGEASLEATIRVVDEPVIERFYVDREWTGVGEAVVVHWITTAAIHVELWVGDDRILESSLAQGSHELALLMSSTLELRAFNEVGTSAVATLEVEVAPPQMLRLDAIPDILWLGETVTFEWESVGGSSLEIYLESTHETVCEVDGHQAIEASSCVWQPAAAGLHTVSFLLGNLSASSTFFIEVYVGDGPLITHFAAGPEILTAGDEIEVSWTVLRDPAGNEPTIQLEDDRGNTYSLPAGSEGSYMTALPDPGAYELRLTAATDDPRSLANLATAEVFVHPRPEVNFVATPAIFDDSLADEVVLSWATQDAETLSLYRLENESQVQLLELLGADREAGSYSFVPAAAQRYRLVATNTIGGQTIEEVEITLAPTEVLSFTAEPTSFTQGQEITLRWTSRMADGLRLSVGSERYLLEETNAPYLDLSELGGTHVPLTDACGAIDLRGCAQIQFPPGFNFPFGGVNHSSVWVHTPGYLSFGADGHGSELTNRSFPTDTQYAMISLAPFWDALGWSEHRYPTGNIHTALLEEGGAAIFVIQWKAIGYPNGDQRNASLNFEVVLREDGSFDYRYGTQSANGTSVSTFSLNGGSATIGFQLPDQRDHSTLLYNGAGELNGIRDHRTFSYRPLPLLPPSGELRLRPLAPQSNFPITLTATRGEVSHAASVNLEVARKPRLTLTQGALPPVNVGEVFPLGWRTFDTDHISVLDAAGGVICAVTDQRFIEEGLCEISEGTAGSHTYTIRADGAHGASVERTVEVVVLDDFGVITFTTSSESVELGADVLLEWQVIGADSVTLFAGDAEIFRDESGAREGSFLVDEMEAETEFRLLTTNRVGATDEATLTVGLWPFTLGLQATADTVRPGDPIDVSFNARLLGGGDPVRVYGLLPIVEDMDPLRRYSDISALPSASQLAISGTSTSTMADVVFPEGFRFPYMDAEYDRLRASVAGYVSFTPGALTLADNQELPTSFSQGVHVHLAPFWDNLTPRNIGQMHTALTSQDTFVIQWSKMSLNQGSSIANTHDLNFQLVLHRSGAFEFRYGTMAGHIDGTTQVGCLHGDCHSEANGSAATIGYQLVGAGAAHTFHFGGVNPVAGSLPVEGGLSHRTFRYPSFQGSESFTLRPNRSETFSLCVALATETMCREFSVYVPFGLSSIHVDDESLEQGDSTTLRWRSVGGKTLRILDGDRVVYETSSRAEVDQGAVALSPTKTTLYEVELLAGARRQSVQQLVEVAAISISASASPSSGLGAPITLDWAVSSDDPGTELHVLRPLEEISNEDFSDLDISNDPDAIQLVGANQNSLSARHGFTDGFTFPYFGTTYDFIYVNTDGYLNFASGNSIANNQPLPSTFGVSADVAIAPFWDDLHTRVNGRIYAKRIDEDRYVIQWSRMSLQWGSSDLNPGDLNFMVVLHRDGSFDLRYGEMRAPHLPARAISDCNPLSCEQETNGASATIGYQLPGGAAGFLQHYGGTDIAPGQLPVPGGISARAWRFTPQTSAGPGSAVVHPANTTLYRICAYVTASSEVVCSETVPVEFVWGIDLFQANPVAPPPGQPITLSWSVQNLDRLRIYANGIAIAHHLSPAIPPLGSVSHTPTEAVTSYIIEGVSMRRTITREVVVHTRTFDLEVDAPTGIFFPGQVVNIDWRFTKNVPDELVAITPMSEIEIGNGGQNGYVDISQFAGAEPITLATDRGQDPASFGKAYVAIPFTFPYLGSPQKALQVHANGYISFAGHTGDSFGSNSYLPNDGSSQSRVHMAVFWDDLYLHSASSIWRYAPDASTLILQWKGISRREQSTDSVQYDLNFQAVLRADGSFEYRYGVMAPPPSFSFSGCVPSDCSNEANGSSATIGYQTVDAQLGSIVHLGSYRIGTSLIGNSSFAFPGGLSNRTFRYSPLPVGSARIVVSRTLDQQVCGKIGGFVECSSVPVAAVAASGELIFTELMIAPSNGLPGQWFELRNLSNRPIDLGGFELRALQGSHTIQGSLPVAPGGFVTIASSTQVPFSPDYILGGDVPLGRFFERLELFAGEAMISTAAWGLDWRIPRNQALSLDPSFHQTGVPFQPAFASWCQLGPSGSPGSLGAGCLSPWYDVDPASRRPFVDISTTGTRLYELEGDGAVTRVSSGTFPITFFGERHSALWISSKGWISFSDTLPAQGASFSMAPQALPRTSINTNALKGPLLMAFWDHLRCGRACRVFHEERVVDGEKKLLIQWEDFYITTSYLSEEGDQGSVTFQLQIGEAGDITVVFGSIHNPYPIGATWASYEGSGAMIALEAADFEVFVLGHKKWPIGLEQRTFHFRSK